MRLAENAWEDATPETGDIATLKNWLAQGRPLIVRRPCLSENGDEVFLGLALPGKRRLGYRVPVEAVASIERPPMWQGGQNGNGGRTLRMFGSHAWEALTGLSYVTATSDLDLLADLATPEEWRAFLADGPEFPAEARVDLEVILGGDAAFSWREYLGPADDILIKSNRRVWLERKARLAELFA